jgi:hypothetical protein
VPDNQRLLVDISRSPAGRLEGAIQRAPDGDPTSFSGTLELLKVIESALDEAPADGDPEPSSI